MRKRCNLGWLGRHRHAKQRRMCMNSRVAVHDHVPVVQWADYSASSMYWRYGPASNCPSNGLGGGYTNQVYTSAGWFQTVGAASGVCVATCPTGTFGNSVAAACQGWKPSYSLSFVLPCALRLPSVVALSVAAQVQLLVRDPVCPLSSVKRRDKYTVATTDRPCLSLTICGLVFAACTWTASANTYVGQFCL